VEIRIGISDSPREIDLEMAEGTTQESIIEAIESSVSSGSQIVWLTDKKGRKLGIFAAKLAYIEVGAAKEDRRVGFGAP
jgi:phosphoheptose isomerase